jgi:DNA-binding NarL/FixJ family response regulator
MTSGLRNKEIAANCIREKTVKSYLNNIFLKLGLEGRFALSVFDQKHPRLKT